MDRAENAERREKRMDTEVLTRLVQVRHELLRQLAELARRQPELIRAADMNRLLSLLAVKQRLLNELLKVDRQLDPFRSQDPEQRTWRTVEARDRCREMVHRSEDLLREIRGIEQECETELAARRDHAAESLRRMHEASRATQAYDTQSYGSGEPFAQGTHFDASCES
jgi:hypothetical protein